MVAVTDTLSKPDALYEEIRRLPLKDGVRVVNTHDYRSGGKGWVGSMNDKFGMSSAWASATLGYWEGSGRVELVREGRYITGIRLPEDQPKPEPTSLKDQVHDLMQRYADNKGRVHKETDEMRRELGVSPHDFIKAVWDLQKQGVVTFRQTGSGSSANLINYRLRGYRTNVVAFDDPENPLTTKPWDICPDCFNTRKTHKLSLDNRGLVCPSPKEGSPLAVRFAEEAAAKQANGDVRPKPEPIRPQLTNYVQCPECGSTFTDNVSLGMHVKAKHAPPPRPVPVPSPEDFAQARTVVEKPGVDWSKYPLLTDVIKHYHARLAAISALQLAGEEQMASDLMNKEESISGEQREVIGLLTALGYEG